MKKLLLSLSLMVILSACKENDFEKKDTRTAASPSQKEEVQNVSKSTIYYFHGTARCFSCKKIEEYTTEVFKENFSGDFDFKVVNVELPENRHFIADYKIYSKSVILVKAENNREIGYRNLNRIWNLLMSKNRFKSYIKTEVENFLGSAI